jgi:uncharacterized protein YodC (DUF2158 family)
MQRINEGDVVQLKSGGPEMTVKSFGVGGVKASFVCTWFSGTKLEKAVFSEAELKLIKPADKA